MKKVLFAVALVMGLGSSVAFAGNMVSDVEIVVMVNDIFKQALKIHVQHKV